MGLFSASARDKLADPFSFIPATIFMSEQLDTLSDQALAEMARGGQQAAFQALYERYLSPVYNRLRALLPPEAVEDVTQEVFIAALQGIGGYREQANFRTWIAGIIRHKVADYYRRRGRQPEVLSLDDEVSDVTDPNARQEEDVIVRAALWRLPSHYQEVLLLRFAEGMPFDQIAQQLGLSLEATKSRYRRAIAAMAQEMQVEQRA